MYSMWLSMKGKLASRWPLTLISGICASGPYVERASFWTALEHREMTSLATHFMKISPMNSDSDSLAPGENQGELKVSVRARCCSAMTRREMRCGGVSKTVTVVYWCRDRTYRTQNGVHELVERLGGEVGVALQDAHGQLGYHGEMSLEHLCNDVAEPLVILEGLDLLELPERIKG